MNILFIIYDIVFILGLTLYLPIYFYRKKITFSALLEKFGFIPRINNKKKSIWIQVVSVGEANLIQALIKRLNATLDYNIIISTTTVTGNKVAKRKYSHLAKIIFFPFDISCILGKVIKIINPKIFIAVETEIWPNLFYRLKRKGIPIVIINGRISNKAFEKYKKIKPILKHVLNKCNYVGVQNKAYMQKFISLGCSQDKITVSGNMKFENIEIDEKHLLEVKDKFTPLLKSENRLLIVGGSTHSPEEEILLKIYKDLCDSGEKLSLLLAPRHIDRVASIEKIVKDLEFTPVRISTLKNYSHGGRNVFLLDTIGELLYFYSLCDICFMGGSLMKHGGQNILEPIYFLKPTVFGPYMDNFPDIEEVALAKGAGIKVEDPEKLKEVILRLTKDQPLRSNLRCKCSKIFEEERKGLEKNLQIILKYI
jgi:3-deoxy-D-manno-octulosonic-acid transferase